MRTAFEDFGATRTKTLDPAVFTAHVASYYNHYGTLRGEKLLLRWARQSFRLYCLKRKTLKEFVNQFRGNPKPGGKPPPLWAQGGALFPSGGPGERSVPVKGTRELIRETFPTVFVDEFNTTKMCSICGLPVQVFKGRKTFPDGSIRLVHSRGILRGGLRVRAKRLRVEKSRRERRTEQRAPVTGARTGLAV